MEIREPNKYEKIMRLFKNKKAAKLQKELNLVKIALFESLNGVDTRFTAWNHSNYDVLDSEYDIYELINILEQNARSKSHNNYNINKLKKENKTQKEIIKQKDKTIKDIIKQKDKIIEELIEQKMKYIEFIRNIKK